jgi:NADH-quinone oxidoreductase subunit G
VPAGTTVWEAARQVGIEIPYFCHHPKLKPVGACRQCVVEIEKMPKLQTSCTTPVAEGMVVRSASPAAVQAQEAVLEFLLLNHPLDCPICDKGGECPLQDFTFRYGPAATRSVEPRLKFEKALPISPNIVIDQERCVMCFRCTRYYSEVVHEEELVATDRGAHSAIQPAPGRQLESIFSGNIIELCPVGALTSRRYRFRARPWDQRITPSVCAHCSVGCNLNLWTRRGILERVTIRDNAQVDGGWLCDRGRFEIDYVNSPERLERPSLLAPGGRREVEWDEALAAAAEGLGGPSSGAGAAVVAGSALTNEDLYVLLRLSREGLLSAPVHMAGRTSLPLVEEPLPIAAIAQCRRIVVAASDPENETPIIDLWLKRAVTRNGAALVTVNARRMKLEHLATSALDAPEGAAARLDAVASDLPDVLMGDGPAAILFGDAGGHEDGGEIAEAARRLARVLGVQTRLLPLLRGANEFGGATAGFSRPWPHTLSGRPVLAVGLQPSEAPIVAGASFLVWHGALRPEGLDPEVMLPGLTYPEMAGSITNLEGRVQRLHPGLVPRYPRRPAWAMAQDLAAALGTNLGYVDLNSVQLDVAGRLPRLAIRRAAASAAEIVAT